MSTLLAVESLRVARDHADVLRSVDLSVARREVCALMGLSGSGKTTVLRAVAALQAFDGGQVAVDGFTLTPGPVPPESRLGALRSKVGLVFQGHALFEHLTVLENVTLAPIHALRWAPDRAERAALDLLTSLGVSARAGAYPREISGGEAQRVAIARALGLGPALLLMDEPTAALDPARRGSLGDTLRGLATEGRGLLIATHDAEFARQYADRVVILADGAVVEEGGAAQVLTQPSHAATRELLRSPAPAPVRAPGRRSGIQGKERT